MINRKNKNGTTANTWTRMLTVTTLVLAAGCSGGGSSNDLQSGVFIDSPVAGVAYATATQSGTTDSAGRFAYLPGETVSFSLGSLSLGSVPGATEITLFDLANIATPPSNQKQLEALLIGAPGTRGPLHRVIGTAILLQTLDSDANPSNGITIDPAVAALLPSDEIDLSRPYWEVANGGNYRDGRGLLGVIRVAVADGVLTPRAVRHPALALDHALGQLNINLGIYGSTGQSRDNNGDGTLDWIRNITYTPDGDVLQDEYDNDGNGIADQVFQSTYNANLKLVSTERDDNLDGSPDSRTVYEYDDFGNLIRREVFDAVGSSESLEAQEFDALGRMVRREVRTLQSHTIQHWVVDENNFRSTYELDTDGDGNIDRRDQLFYNGGFRSDLWVQRDIDSNLDGAMDGQQFRTFDEENRMLTDRRDLDLDGTNEYELVATYNEFGQTSVDRSGSGTTAYRSRQFYNAQGRTIRTESDSDYDGIFENIHVYTFDGDNVVQHTNDTNGDGQLERITTWTYDINGNQVSSSRDRNADGIIDETSTSQYDSQDNLLRTAVDNGNDGSLDYVQEFSGWSELGLGAYF